MARSGNLAITTRERGIDCSGNLTHYVVSIALSRSKHLTYLSRMVLGFEVQRREGAANRLDVLQLRRLDSHRERKADAVRRD